MNLTSRVSHLPARPRPTPTALLGNDHPLVRDLERLAVARNQLLVVAALFAGSVVALLAGLPGAGWMIAAVAATALLLAFRAAVLLESRRAHVLEVVCQGRADLPIPAVEQMCVRLRRASHRQRLLRSIDALLEAKVQHWALVVTPWQFSSADMVAPIRYELMEIGALLRDDGAGLAGIAMMERLLFDGTSSLHGDDPRLLREDLSRARFLLEVGR